MPTDNIVCNDSARLYEEKMNLFMWYTAKLATISLKAKKYRKERNSEKVIAEWKELKLNQLNKEYNDRLKKIEESRH